MRDNFAHWDQLHENPRFRPHYPNDHVVRFLMGRRKAVQDGAAVRLLDIGTGAGRHVQLAAELGFDPCGIDTSYVGLRHAHERMASHECRVRFAQASMLQLPFADCAFGLVLSFGTFYYGTADEMRQAIAETWRVLVPKGSLFAVLRTIDDYRCGRGEQTGTNTYRLKISDTNEYDTVQHFLSADDVTRYFERFSDLRFEKTETTSSNRTRIDSDWLISATK